MLSERIERGERTLRAVWMEGPEGASPGFEAVGIWERVCCVSHEERRKTGVKTAISLR